LFVNYIVDKFTLQDGELSDVTVYDIPTSMKTKKLGVREYRVPSRLRFKDFKRFIARSVNAARLSDFALVQDTNVESEEGQKVTPSSKYYFKPLKHIVEKEVDGEGEDEVLPPAKSRRLSGVREEACTVRFFSYITVATR